MRIAFALAPLLLSAACTRWSPQPVTPARAFTDSGPRDVAVRLRDDSTHWWRVRGARLQGDTIVGWTRLGGRLRAAAVPVDRVDRVVVREEDREATDALMQLAGFASILGMLELLGLSLPIFH
jgi:hypothetical protein